MASTPRARSWLSRSLSDLFDRHYRRRQNGQKDDRPPRFDVVIVGSGYGGAVAAASLAGFHRKPYNGGRSRKLRIAVLERGLEYLPGAFPSGLSELPGHVRFSSAGTAAPRGVRTGLFDIRVSADVVSIVANGLGGGSLINAGVMLPADASVLAEARWPTAISSNPNVLKPFYDRIAQSLGAVADGMANTVERAGVAPTKFGVMRAAGEAATKAVPITVALTPGRVSSGGVKLNACLSCGDCATGCNHAAKESLDVNLLVHAWRRGVRIYTGATVLRLEKIDSGWSVVVTHTDEALRQRRRAPFRIEANKVILAAGTFGSTEILMRSGRKTLSLSRRLGTRFSGNGDLFAAVYNTPDTVKAVATESVSPADRNIGPTITACIDKRQGDPNTDLVIQELAVPGGLRRLFEELFTTARTLHNLRERDLARHRPGDGDRNAVDPAAVGRTLPIALISRDRADGELVFAGRAGDDEGDGAVRVRWRNAGRDPRFDAHHRVAADLFVRSGSGAQLLPNPLWKVLPDDVAQRLGIDRGPLTTVHPLGGCPMADDATSGVVNHLGQVFRLDRGDPTDVYEGLVVLDGAIVPTSLGINPALTIAALALRAIEELRDKRWGFVDRPGLRAHAEHQSRRLVSRPVLCEPRVPAEPRPTKVQFIERLRGDVRLADTQKHHLALTLHSRPVALSDLMSPVAAQRRVDYDPRGSVLRVLNRAPSLIEDEPRDWPANTGRRKQCPLELQARARLVSGSLDIFQLESTRGLVRVGKAVPAWLQHRGIRDALQGLFGRGLSNRSPGWKDILDAVGIATRAGAIRRFDYALRFGNVEVAPGTTVASLFGRAADRAGVVLEARGRKRLVYDGRSSPWQQLMELELSQFPGLTKPPVTLKLDLAYLARQGVPLMRVVEQQDHVQALADLASFHLYALRTVLDAHVWSFRRPDTVPDRKVCRLPGPIRGVRDWDHTDLEVTRIGNTPVKLRLTRYSSDASRRAGAPPVLLIHGYSASGTTFAHPTLRPGLAGRLVQEGRDAWILDLRSSAGMRWSRHPWTFEEIGCEDIPLAIEHIFQKYRRKVDVVAHCMGAAMLCMALLGDIKHDERYRQLREEMRDRIGKIVLSQVGPLLVLSPTNQARAFVMRYVKQIVPMGDYRFRPDGDGSMADQLLDRLLATLPYPADEFRRENPLWPPWAGRPWVRTRRRIDALYGQVFKLANMSSATLRALDDFFGPMNVETVSQVIHFARTRTITDAQGRHVFATRDRLHLLQKYDVLSIHGRDNGLVDVSTADLLTDALGRSHYHAACFDDFGHQDCLIGRNTRPIFDTIVRFLGAPVQPPPVAAPPAEPVVLEKVPV